MVERSGYSQRRFPVSRAYPLDLSSLRPTESISALPRVDAALVNNYAALLSAGGPKLLTPPSQEGGQGDVTRINLPRISDTDLTTRSVTRAVGPGLAGLALGFTATIMAGLRSDGTISRRTLVRATGIGAGIGGAMEMFGTAAQLLPLVTPIIPDIQTAGMVNYSFPLSHAETVRPGNGDDRADLKNISLKMKSELTNTYGKNLDTEQIGIDFVKAGDGPNTINMGFVQIGEKGGHDPVYMVATSDRNGQTFTTEAVYQQSSNDNYITGVLIDTKNGEQLAGIEQSKNNPDQVVTFFRNSRTNKTVFTQHEIGGDGGQGINLDMTVGLASILSPFIAKVANAQMLSTEEISTVTVAAKTAFATFTPTETRLPPPTSLTKVAQNEPTRTNTPLPTNSPTLTPSPTNSPTETSTPTPFDTPTPVATMTAILATKERPTQTPDQRFAKELLNLAGLSGISGNSEFITLLKAGDLIEIENKKLGAILRKSDGTPGMLIITSGVHGLPLDSESEPGILTDYKRTWEFLKTNVPTIADNLTGDWNVKMITAGANCELDGGNPCVFGSESVDARTSSSLPGTGADNSRGNIILVNTAASGARLPGMALFTLIGEGIQGAAKTGLKGKPQTAWDPWSGYRVRLPELQVDGQRVTNLEWYTYAYDSQIQLPQGPDASGYYERVNAFRNFLEEHNVPRA